MDNQSPIDLDLNALQPKTVNIKYGDQTITVEPMTLEQYAKLVNISSEVVEAQKSNDPNSVISLYQKLKSLIDEVIPDFASVTLNPQQILAIYKLLTELSTPEDKTVAALASQGVEMKHEGSSDPKASIS